MYSWDAEQICYMRDALRFSDYYQCIAERIVPHLPPNAVVCDAGCGLGELGLTLLPHCHRVVCVDEDSAAVADLRARAPRGVTVLCGDVEKCPPTIAYDAMIFCLFGSTEQALRIAKAQCRGIVFLIKRNYNYHRFSAGEFPLGDYTARNTEKELKERGIPFALEDFDADFSQPLRDMAEARRFFQLHNRCPEPMAEGEIAARLQKGPTEEFPFLLPHTKHLRLFTLQVSDIPRFDK